MDFEALAELLVPLAFLAIIGGLIALRMLKPYGNRILELVREIQQERHQALSETRDMQVIRDRLDMLTERQDFLEALLRNRLDEVEVEAVEELRREALGTGGAGAPSSRAGAAGADAASGPASSTGASGGDGGSAPGGAARGQGSEG